MKRALPGIGTLFSLTLLMACTAPAWAQRVTFTAEVSQPKIGLQDQLIVTYTITDVPNLVSLVPGGFSGFQMIEGPYQQQSSNVSIQGNQRVQSTSVSLIYVLKPRHVGQFTFPVAVAKDANGRTYQSNCIKVEVVNGSVQPEPPSKKNRQRQSLPVGSWGQLQQQLQNAPAQIQPPASPPRPKADVRIGKDIFIKAVADKTTAFVGQPILVSYKLYTRLPMQLSISKLPAQRGFWAEELGEPRNSRQPTEQVEVLDGQRYNTYLIRQVVLYPQEAGTLSLGAAEGDGTVYVPLPGADLSRSPFDPFEDDPFGMPNMAALMQDPFGMANPGWQAQAVHLKSTPMSIQVNPLPAGAPEDFTGAVGTGVSMQAVLTEKSNQGGRLVLTLTGPANLKLSAPPTLNNLPEGLSAYEPVIKDSVALAGGRPVAWKEVSYPIVGSKTGRFSLPPVHISYFDPMAKTYKRLEATVPGNLDIQVQALASAPVTQSQPENKPRWWAWALAPVALGAGLLVFKKLKQPRQQQNASALDVATQRLAQAKGFLDASAGVEFYQEIDRATWLYAADLLRLPLSELTREEGLAALSTAGAHAQTVGLARRITDACQMALYAPAAAQQNLQAVYEDAQTLIHRLHQELGQGTRRAA